VPTIFITFSISGSARDKIMQSRSQTIITLRYVLGFRV